MSTVIQLSENTLLDGYVSVQFEKTPQNVSWGTGVSAHFMVPGLDITVTVIRLSLSLLCECENNNPISRCQSKQHRKTFISDSITIIGLNLVQV